MNEATSVSASTWVWYLVDLAAAQAAGRSDGMDKAFERLRAAGRDSEVEEALLQSYLFVGFPSAIEAFRQWRTYGAAAPRASAETSDLWSKRGAQVCSAVYGDHYDSLRDNMARFHPDLDAWMVSEGYGKVLGRPGLGLDARELLIIAMLVVQGAGARRQLRSHLHGALNTGVAAEDVEGTIDRAAVFTNAENVALARKLWAAVSATNS